MRRTFAGFLCLTLTLSLLLCGCAKKNPTSQTVEMQPIVDPVPPEPELPRFTNPLTGLETAQDISQNRPYAVMLNNLTAALPQYGNASADMIFEVLAEGGITRMIAFFQDASGIGSIGSVRSARPYYVELALAYDAVYIHAGGCPKSYSDLKTKQVDHIDGVNGSMGVNAFFRDQGRIKSSGYEHSMFTSSDRIAEHIDTLETLRHEHEEGYEHVQTFQEDGTPDGTTARIVRAYFTNTKKTSFEYFEDNGLYMVYEYGSAYLDGNTMEQVGVENVLCLFTDVGMIAGDNKGRLSVRTTGEGDGYYACGGQITEITWSRSGTGRQFIYRTTDGSPLVMGAGHTYICILPMSGSVAAE